MMQAIQNFHDLHSAQIEKIKKKLAKKSKKVQSLKNDDILDITGHDGLWQRCIFLWMVFATIPVAAHFMAMSFYVPKLDYWCARPEGSNWTVEEWKEIALPEDKRCSRFRNVSPSLNQIDTKSPVSSRGEIVACDSWEYDTSFYSSTVLSQFDLVCEREWLVSLSTSVFYAGVIVSNLIIGHLADKLGRKPLIVASLIIQLSSAIICAFSTSFVMFAATRFFTAFGLSGVYNVSFVLLTEIFGPKQRPFYCIAMNIGWCIGFVAFPGIVWILRDWLWIQVVITGPLVVLLCTCWLLPESARWLMSKGRAKEAQKIISNAASTNGWDVSNIEARLKEMIIKNSVVNESSSESGTIIDLFRSPGLWQETFIIFFTWFSFIFVYHGLSYNTNELTDDPFVNFAVSGAVQFPAYLLAMVAIYSQGRRRPLAVNVGIAGLICFLTYPLPSEPWWFTTMLSMMGKFCITTAASITYVLTAEIFPTIMRTIGLGSASLCLTVGLLLAPFIRELGHATHPVSVQVFCGLLAFLTALLVLFLPETKGLRLPENLSEAASRKKPLWMKNEKSAGFEMKIIK